MVREKILLKRVTWETFALVVLLIAALVSLLWYEYANKLPIQASPGYRLSVFASGNTSYWSPDSVAVDQGHVFLDYVNNTLKDGSDHKTSTIVEYKMDGNVITTFSISGHSDGMRIDPKTHLVWALSNEVGNPWLTIIDPTNGHSTKYTFPPTAHQGGYDDLYFLKGQKYPFLSASNPTLDKNGRNNYPSVYQIMSLVDGNPGTANVTPILQGNATAKDMVTHGTVTLNEIDPDALSTDLQGDLVLIDQGSGDVVIISFPGTPRQEVRHLSVGTHTDDTVWIPSANGRLLIVDAARNQTYWMETTFKPSTVYTESYPDSSVQSVVGQLDLTTGTITIVATGFLKPTGLLFVPD